jgi:hypothetical protein
VADTTPPSLKLPDPITSPAGGSPITFAVSATDLVDPSPSVACSPASGAWFGVGKTSVGCTATDKAGNTSKGSFAVTVTDSAPPSLKLSGVPSGVSKSSVTITATATDPGGVKSITSSVGSNTTTVGGSSASVSISAEGTTSVSFTATDLNGNTTAPVGATVKIDKTAPVVHVPAPIDMEVASTATGANVSYTASASDNLDASPSLSCDHASGSRFGLGTTRVTCTATDSAGNSAAQSFTVTISRLEPPPRPAPCGLLADDPTGDPTAGPTADLQAAAIPNCPLRPV